MQTGPLSPEPWLWHTISTILCWNGYTELEYGHCLLMLANHSKFVALGKARGNGNSVMSITLLENFTIVINNKALRHLPLPPQKKICIGFLLNCMTACLYSICESEYTRSWRYFYFVKFWSKASHWLVKIVLLVGKKSVIFLSEF